MAGPRTEDTASHGYISSVDHSLDRRPTVNVQVGSKAKSYAKVDNSPTYLSLTKPPTRPIALVF